MKSKTRKTPKVLHRGSLMTWGEDGSERCLGYLFDFPGRGVFEPDFGKLDVSAGEAALHNQCLSQAEIEGLDTNCRIGLGGMFYARKELGRILVTTWLGQEVSREVCVRGGVITFIRKGMTFRGRLRQEEDCFYFKRIR